VDTLVLSVPPNKVHHVELWHLIIEVQTRPKIETLFAQQVFLLNLKHTSTTF
jgi:hypothetical protein